MLQSVTLTVAISVLASACALAEPPQPPGTFIVQGEVRNERGPVELTVTTPDGGVFQGHVRPASLPPRSTTNVTFYLPITGDWTIAVDGVPFVARDGLGPEARQGRTLGIDLYADGGTGLGYLDP